MRVDRIVALLALLGLWLAPDLGALAQELALPTPKTVIYPGDVIKVRNSDSGVTVSGAVQPDGTVRVSGG